MKLIIEMKNLGEAKSWDWHYTQGQLRITKSFPDDKRFVGLIEKLIVVLVFLCEVDTHKQTLSGGHVGCFLLTTLSLNEFHDTSYSIINFTGIQLTHFVTLEELAKC